MAVAAVLPGVAVGRRNGLLMHELGGHAIDRAGGLGAELAVLETEAVVLTAEGLDVCLA